MKQILACLSFVLVSGACAEFDLVSQSRFNPLSAVVGRFTHIAFDNEDGFFAAGHLGVDGVIAKFDANRNLVAFQRWDHPNLLTDIVEKFERDALGRLYVTFTTDNGTGTSPRHTVVQYSKTLQKNWEYAFDSTLGGNKHSATLPTGETGIAWQDDDVVHLRILSPSGVVLQNLSTTTADEFGSICAVPTVGASRGFALSGVKTGKPWFARFNVAGQTIYDVTDTMGPNIRFQMYSDENGGLTCLSIGTGSHFAKVSPSGEVVTQQDFGYSGGYQPSYLDRVNATTARARYGVLMVDFNTQSLGPQRRYHGRDGITSWAHPEGGNLLGGGVSKTFQEWKQELVSETITSDMSPDAGGLRSGGAQQFVGWNPTSNRPAISTERSANSMGHEDILLSGYSRRDFINSTLAPSGEVAIMSRTYYQLEYQSIPYPFFLVVYNPNGELKFARALNGVYPLATIPLDDGSYVVLGHSLAEDDMPSISRVSSTGILTHTKSYQFTDLSLGSSVDASLTRIPGSADVLLHVRRNPGNHLLCRVRPNGSFAYSVGYAPSLAQLISLPTGRVAMMQQMSGGATVLRFINPATGLPEISRSIEMGTFRAFLDLPGSGIALVDSANGFIRTRRISEATMVATHTAQLPEGRTHRLVRTGPTGRIAVFSSEGSAFKAMVYNGADLSPAHPEIDLPVAVTELRDAGLNNTNHLYALGSAPTNWAAKYSPTGGLLKIIAPAERAEHLHATSTGVWLMGEVGTRFKGSGPFASRYSK